ncbi:hypothetical protein [Micromonospora sp. NPDC049102]|uniref:hypothetical protein n=1 Tax=Micromonospora sp. NPDC049102 TaxID=3364265 RepID=UPI003711F15C
MQVTTPVDCPEFLSTWVPSGIFLDQEHGAVPAEVLEARPVPGMHMIHVASAMADSAVLEALLTQPLGVVARMAQAPPAPALARKEAEDRADALRLPVLVPGNALADPENDRMVPIDAQGHVASSAAIEHVLILPASHLVAEHAAATVMGAHSDLGRVLPGPVMPSQFRLAGDRLEVGLPQPILNARYTGLELSTVSTGEATRTVESGIAGLMRELTNLTPGKGVLMHIPAGYGEVADILAFGAPDGVALLSRTPSGVEAATLPRHLTGLTLTPVMFSGEGLAELSAKHSQWSSAPSRQRPYGAAAELVRMVNAKLGEIGQEKIAAERVAEVLDELEARGGLSRVDRERADSIFLHLIGKRPGLPGGAGPRIPGPRDLRGLTILIDNDRVAKSEKAKIDAFADRLSPAIAVLPAGRRLIVELRDSSNAPSPRKFLGIGPGRPAEMIRDLISEALRKKIRDRSRIQQAVQFEEFSSSLGQATSARPARQRHVDVTVNLEILPPDTSRVALNEEEQDSLVVARLLDGRQAEAKILAGGLRRAAPPNSLSALLPPDRWWQLHIDPRHHVDAVDMVEKGSIANPGQYYDRDQSPGWQRGMEHAYQTILNRRLSGDTRELNWETYRSWHRMAISFLGRERLGGAPQIGGVNLALQAQAPAQDLLEEHIGGTKLLATALEFYQAIEAGGTGQRTPTTPVIAYQPADHVAHNFRGEKFFLLSYLLPFDQKSVVDHIFTEFRNKIASANSDFDRLREIGRVVRNLHVSHVFDDGNGRLNVYLLLPYLMLNYGFMPPHVNEDEHSLVFAQRLYKLFNGGFSADQIATALMIMSGGRVQAPQAAQDFRQQRFGSIDAGVEAREVPSDHTAESLRERYGWLGAINPGYAKGGEYATNCIIAAISMDMSMRDPNQEAVVYEATTTEPLTGVDLLNYQQQVLGLPDDQELLYNVSNIEAAVQALRAAAPGARAFIVMRQPGRIGHILVGIRDEHGAAVIDPQTGQLAKSPLSTVGLSLIPLSHDFPQPQAKTIAPSTEGEVGDATAAPSWSVRLPDMVTAEHPNLYVLDVAREPGASGELARQTLIAQLGEMADVDRPVVMLWAARLNTEPLASDVAALNYLLEQLAQRGQLPVIVSRTKITEELLAVTRRYGAAIVHTSTRKPNTVSIGLDTYWTARPSSQEDHPDTSRSTSAQITPDLLSQAITLAHPTRAVARVEDTLGELIWAPSLATARRVFTTARQRWSPQQIRDNLTHVRQMIARVPDQPELARYAPVLEFGASGHADIVFDYALADPTDRPSTLLTAVGNLETAGQLNSSLDGGLTTTQLAHMVTTVGTADISISVLNVISDIKAGEFTNAATYIDQHRGRLNTDEKGHWVQAIADLQHVPAMEKNRGDLEELAAAVMNC